MAERKPRDPDQHEYTGTGSTRAADDGLPQEGAYSGGEDVDPAISTGARATSDPAHSDELNINRSGSGGSGGPVEADDAEGSSGASMSELLTGEDDPQ